MVKETKFDHHAVRVVKGLSLGTEYKPGQIIYLDFQTAALKTITDSGDLSWSLIAIDDELPSGVTRPVNAIAAILDIEVNDDSSSSATYLAVATPGIIVAGKTQYIHCSGVNTIKASRMVIVEITGDGKFAYMINAQTNFDALIKLIGWVIAGTLTTPITLPNEELFARFSVNQ